MTTLVFHLHQKIIKNTASKQIFIDIPREDTVLSLKIEYLEFNFDVVHAAEETLYDVDNDTNLVNTEGQ